MTCLFEHIKDNQFKLLAENEEEDKSWWFINRTEEQEALQIMLRQLFPDMFVALQRHYRHWPGVEDLDINDVRRRLKKTNVRFSPDDWWHQIVYYIDLSDIVSDPINKAKQIGITFCIYKSPHRKTLNVTSEFSHALGDSDSLGISFPI